MDVFICSEGGQGESLAGGELGNLYPQGCRELPRNHVTGMAIVFPLLLNDTPESGEMLEFQLYKRACRRDPLSPPSLAPRPDTVTVNTLGHLSF